MILYMASYKYVWRICEEQFAFVVFQPLIREKVKVIFYTTFPDFPKEHCYLESYQPLARMFFR